MIYLINNLSNEIKRALIEKIIKEFVDKMYVNEIFYIRKSNNGYKYGVENIYNHSNYSALKHGNVLDLLLEFNIPVVWDISKDDLYNSVRIEDNKLRWSTTRWDEFDNYLYYNDNTLLYSVRDKEESIKVNKGDLVYGRRNGHYIACYYDKYEDNLYYCSDEYGSNTLSFNKIFLKIPQKISIIQQNL